MTTMAISMVQRRHVRPAAVRLIPSAAMRVLVFTNMYPTPDAPFYGTFVADEVDSLRRAGVAVDVYFVNGRHNKLSYAGMPAGFYSRLLSGDYHIVHVHHSFCGALAVLQHDVPVVWTFHEGAINAQDHTQDDARVIKYPAYSKGLKRWVAARVDALIAVSERVREPLGREDAVVIPSGVDLERFIPMDRDVARHTVGLPAGRRYVLFPSSPSRREKRYPLARCALDRLHEIAPETHDVELVVLDEVPHNQVPFYMNAADVVLMTSAFEASPVTIREALACNVPVVSTAVGDVPVLLDGVDGCRIASADIDDLAQALRTVLATRRRVHTRERMAVYSRERQAEMLIDVYRGVLEARSGRRRP